MVIPRSLPGPVLSVGTQVTKVESCIVFMLVSTLCVAEWSERTFKKKLLKKKRGGGALGVNVSTHAPVPFVSVSLPSKNGQFSTVLPRVCAQESPKPSAYPCRYSPRAASPDSRNNQISGLDRLVHVPYSAPILLCCLCRSRIPFSLVRLLFCYFVCSVV